MLFTLVSWLCGVVLSAKNLWLCSYNVGSVNKGVKPTKSARQQNEGAVFTAYPKPDIKQNFPLITSLAVLKKIGFLQK
jgi:hypothetical protein